MKPPIIRTLCNPGGTVHGCFLDDVILIGKIYMLSKKAKLRPIIS